MMEETSGELWRALLHGLTAEEQQSLTELVQRELREQRAEKLRAAEQDAPRRGPGRPRKLRRT